MGMFDIWLIGSNFYNNISTQNTVTIWTFEYIIALRKSSAADSTLTHLDATLKHNKPYCGLEGKYLFYFMLMPQLGPSCCVGFTSFPGELCYLRSPGSRGRHRKSSLSANRETEVQRVKEGLISRSERGCVLRYIVKNLFRDTAVSFGAFCWCFSYCEIHGNPLYKVK